LKHYVPVASRLIGFTAWFGPGLFPCSAPILDNQPSPGARCSWFILPCGLSSSEFLRFYSRSIPFDAELYLPGFRPSSRYHRVRPLSTGVPKLPLRSAHRLSQPLGGLLRPRLRGLVPSRNHVQGSSRPGASPSVQRPSLVGKNCPLAVVRSALTTRRQLPRSASSTSRPCSTRRSVSPVR
jgi:hypothetical protein